MLSLVVVLSAVQAKTWIRRQNEDCSLSTRSPLFNFFRFHPSPFDSSRKSQELRSFGLPRENIGFQTQYARIEYPNTTVDFLHEPCWPVTCPVPRYSALCEAISLTVTKSGGSFRTNGRWSANSGD